MVTSKIKQTKKPTWGELAAFHDAVLSPSGSVRYAQLPPPLLAHCSATAGAFRGKTARGVEKDGGETKALCLTTHR